MKPVRNYPVLLILFILTSAQLGACSEKMETEMRPNAAVVSTQSNTAEMYFPLPEGSLEVHRSEELDFHVQTVVDGVDVVWGMAFLPNGDMIVTEKEGEMHLIRDGELVEEPISGVPEVYASGQGGLLDIEPHPRYEESGWLYFSYSKPGEGGAMTSIMRARYDGEAHSLTDKEELYTGFPFSGGGRHFGSRISFDPEGYLFFSIGERGRRELAQDITVSNGSLFRLHDDGSIPEDNPFVGREGLDEIYTYGVRNIQGMDVHPETGIIWTNEHGPRGGDEINVHKEGGLNFGWPEITYGINYSGTTITEDTAKPGMEQPVWYWDPSIAPCGMTFVTSDNYPGWKGNILNGALSFQLISRIVVDGEEFVHEERILEGIGRIRDVEEAPDGFIYFSNESNGTINRILPVE